MAARESKLLYRETTDTYAFPQEHPKGNIIVHNEVAEYILELESHTDIMTLWAESMREILETRVDKSIRGDGRFVFDIIKDQLNMLEEDVDFLCTHCSLSAMDEDDPHLQHHQEIIKRWKKRHEDRDLP